MRKLSILLAFLFGLTWDIRFARSYYEIPAFLEIEQKVLEVGFIYHFPNWGYPGSWDVYKTPAPWKR